MLGCLLGFWPLTQNPVGAKMLFCFLSIQALAIKEDVGYPTYIKDDVTLDAHYSTVSYHPHTRFVVFLSDR